MPNPNTQLLDKLKTLDRDPKLAIFIELGLLNDRLKEVIDAVNASKTEEITVKNAEDLKLSLEPLQANFDALGASVNKVTEAIQSIPKDEVVDMSGVEKMLKQLVNKPVEKVDMSALTGMTAILDDILYAVQTSASHSSDKMENPADKIVPSIDGGNKKLLAILDTINQNIVSIEIPDFDYERLAKMIGKIRIGGGGSGGVTFVRNASEAIINPATEETLQANGIIGVLSTVNSSTTPLGISATFTGSAEDTTNYTVASVAIAVDRNGTLNVDFSPDGTNWDQVQSYPITVTTGGVAQGFYYQFMCEAKYFRLRYVNGGTAQAVFRLQTIFKKYAGTSEVQAVNVPLLSNTDALVTKGVIYGLTTGGGGGYVAVKVTPSGAITVGKSGLSGASTNGQTVLTSANTWYAVPSTAPTAPYELTATIETGVGTVRRAFSNTGVPSTTNGEQSTYSVSVTLDANQVIYFGSSSAADSINWSTKII